jgi:hypothetical protein
MVVVFTHRACDVKAFQLCHVLAYLYFWLIYQIREQYLKQALAVAAPNLFGWWIFLLYNIHFD